MASRYDRRRDKRRHSNAWVIGAIILALWIVAQATPELIAIGIFMAFVAAMMLLVKRLLLDTEANATEKRDAVNRLMDFVQRLSSPQTAFASNAQAVADEAMERAGRVLDEDSIHLNDIGLLVYDDEKNPKIYRTSDVPTDACYVRPFIFLFQPEMPEGSGSGVVRFSLIDRGRNLRYTSRKKYRLHPGQNLVTPPTWLPLAGQKIDGSWSLVVTIGDTPLGIIDFDWLQVGGEVRAQFDGDGEIDQRTRRWLDLRGQEPVSLDELLADQAEAEIEVEEPSLELNGIRR
jgi:hypothetical protein